ncbi:hypothetical protein [Yeosuana marina]|uniref:hypothetical protein n=1 Tax=Yeosuana marina TaxID=1565536 RepID=UPI001421BC1F|nr:hypothetical protein [Yeosuana marina]
MKNLFKTIFFSIFTFLIFFFSISSFAQDKSDVVVMLNGEERSGKVMAINDQVITFIYDNETLEYQIKKGEVNKIIFASGRIQQISKNSNKKRTIENSNPLARKGKMAVLPFRIITNMPTIDKDAIGKKIQIDCANTIKEEAPMIDVIDPRVVNATLAKNNIAVDQLQNMLPNELAELLGVENVVFGSYDIENTGTRSYGSSVTTYKSNREKDDNKYKRKGTEINSGSSSTTDTFDSRMTIDIYNDQGSNIYSVSRKPFSAGLDKYHSTISYLIKRAPFGSKR